MSIDFYLLYSGIFYSFLAAIIEGPQWCSSFLLNSAELIFQPPHPQSSSKRTAGPGSDWPWLPNLHRQSPKGRTSEPQTRNVVSGFVILKVWLIISPVLHYWTSCSLFFMHETPLQVVFTFMLTYTDHISKRAIRLKELLVTSLILTLLCQEYMASYCPAGLISPSQLRSVESKKTEAYPPYSVFNLLKAVM